MSLGLFSTALGAVGPPLVLSHGQADLCLLNIFMYLTIL